MNTEFEYIIEKINSQEFGDLPFKHLYIEDFLSEEHFRLLTTDSQIKLDPQPDTRSLITALHQHGYKQIQFPGCVEDVNLYIESYESKSFKIERHWLEAFGMAFNLPRINNKKIQRLVAFLNGKDFQECLECKFGLTSENVITTRIQKYLSGYEISPHPDIRKKSLTYLININTSMDSEKENIHTNLLKFKPEYEYVREYWEDNPTKQRNWIPWDWCDVDTTIVKNNSLIMFAPGNDTLHSVKLSYDHCLFQRTQLYGNLRFKNPPKSEETTYAQLLKLKT